MASTLCCAGERLGTSTSDSRRASNRERGPRGPALEEQRVLVATNTTPVGFEPTQGDPIGLAGRRLNHSAKVSSGNAPASVAKSMCGFARTASADESIAFILHAVRACSVVATYKPPMLVPWVRFPACAKNLRSRSKFEPQSKYNFKVMPFYLQHLNYNPNAIRE